jgi:RNA polymerase sigma-70 factor (ECF subfamily)
MKNMQQLTDDELVKLFIEGNDDCVEVLVGRHKKRVYTYILMNVKQSHLAEDLFQDTFCKALLSLRKGQYSENGRFVSWLLRIAHNLVIDHFRRQKNNATLSSDEKEYTFLNSTKYSDPSIEDQMAYDQILKDVASLVHLLPDVQKEVVMMRHYQGLSFKEIAEETNVSINTALGRMRYAIINLRKLVEERNLSLSV